jgi:abortive infection bacteriophage resistance protein
MQIGHEFLDIDEQISHLETIGVNIGVRSKTKELLSKNSFYNVVNGYREPFLYMKRPNKYITGVTFQEIFHLYKFDRELREWISPFILEIENIIKTEVVYEFSNHKDANGQCLRARDAYLQIDNFDTCDLKHPEKIENAHKMIEKLTGIIDRYYSYSPAFQHYQTHYGYIPLWVLSTQMTFGEVSKFYESMKMQDRNAVSRKYLLSESAMQTILKALTLARNYCAHGNRFYCLRHTITLPVPNLTVYPIQNRYLSAGLGQDNLFGILMCIKYFIPKKRYTHLMNQIENLISCLTKHLSSIHIDSILAVMGFPSDWHEIKK